MWFRAITPQDLKLEKNREHFLTKFRASIQRLITINLLKTSPVVECDELCARLEDIFIFGAKDAPKIWNILSQKAVAIRRDSHEGTVTWCPIRTFLNEKALGNVVQHLLTESLVAELYDEYSIFRDVESRQLFCSLVDGLKFLNFELPNRPMSDISQIVDRVQKTMRNIVVEQPVTEVTPTKQSRKRNKVQIQ